MTPAYGLLKSEDRKKKPWGRTWWVRAPFAHPLWHSYMFSLADLTTPTKQPAIIRMEGATHELVVFALDPAHPETSFPPHLLQPANHGYQFRAESNAAAEQRVLNIIHRIVAQQFSPDTDYRREWDALFHDGKSLLMSRLATHEAPRTVQ